jgi:hypothetical protein
MPGRRAPVRSYRGVAERLAVVGQCAVRVRRRREDFDGRAVAGRRRILRIVASRAEQKVRYVQNGLCNRILTRLFNVRWGKAMLGALTVVASMAFGIRRLAKKLLPPTFSSTGKMKFW